MNPRKMLALLGPRTPSLTRLMHRELGGVSAKHPLGPTDVAHALAYVEDPLAKQVYMAMWCPGWAESSRMPQLVEAVAQRMLAEYRKRQQKGYRDTRPGRERWPPCPPQHADDPLALLRRLSAVALFELGHPADCEACKGFGMVATFDKDAKKLITSRCEVCLGQGYVPYGAKNRARMVRIRLDTFIKHLGAPYRWLLSELRSLEQAAADAHYRALDTEDPADSYVDFVDSSSVSAISSANSKARR